MADIVVDGRTRVAFVPTLASVVAATTAELNAGTLLHNNLVPTGLEGFNSSSADVDNSSMASTFDSKLPGRLSFSGTGLVLKKQDAGVDPVFTLLTTPGTNGFIVIRDELLATDAWASGQRYEAYPIRTNAHSMLGRGEANAVLRYRVPTPITNFLAAYLKGVVA